MRIRMPNALNHRPMARISDDMIRMGESNVASST